MTETVERVARAILAKVPSGYGMTKDEAAGYARAAIEALREPTDAMSIAALIADGSDPFGLPVAHKNPTLTPEEAARIGLADHLSADPAQWKKPLWRAMIDQALKD